MEGVLEKYRKTNKMCVDIALMLVFLALIGILVSILRNKGLL